MDTRTDKHFNLAQRILFTLGLLLSAYAGYLLFTTVKPAGIWGLLVWLFGALLLHDGLLAMVLFVAGQFVRRVGRRIPDIYLAYTQVVVLVGGLLTLLVVPEIIADRHAIGNPTVLVLPYARNLFLIWVGLSVVLVALVLLTRVYRGRRARSVS